MGRYLVNRVFYSSMNCSSFVHPDIFTALFMAANCLVGFFTSKSMNIYPKNRFKYKASMLPLKLIIEKKFQVQVYHSQNQFHFECENVTILVCKEENIFTQQISDFGFPENMENKAHK